MLSEDDEARTAQQQLGVGFCGSPEALILNHITSANESVGSGLARLPAIVQAMAENTMAAAMKSYGCD